LGQDGWNLQYDTTFAVNLNLAECELLTGQLIQAEERLSQLTILAQHDRDRCLEALVSAEVARLEGRHAEAESFYRESIDSAKENGGGRTHAKRVPENPFVNRNDLYLVKNADTFALLASRPVRPEIND
jgi:ATP/maltotriose-dependent transcriptional regulator MalT